MRYCRGCEAYLDESGFYKIGSRCKSCHTKQVERRREETGDASRRNHQYKKLYGITLADYERMFCMQASGCALCGSPPGKRPLHVDHNHQNGRVRGLLCHHCNTGLGNLRDDRELLRRAIKYLEEDGGLD